MILNLSASDITGDIEIKYSYAGETANCCITLAMLVKSILEDMGSTSKVSSNDMITFFCSLLNKKASKNKLIR